MILTKPKSVNAGPSSGTGEGVWELILLFPFSSKFINGVTVVRWLIQSYSQ